MGETVKKEENGLNAGLTVEAALSLTLFLFAVILMAVPMEFLDIHRRVQMVLETASRQLCQAAAWPSGEEETSMKNLLETGAVRIYLEGKIREAVKSDRIGTLDLSSTRIGNGGEWIDLRAEYSLRLPFSTFILPEVTMTARSFRRGWIGGGRREEGSELAQESKTMVYIGRAPTRYHLRPDCHYISNQLSAVSFDAVGSCKSADGKHYRPCHVCAGGAGAGQMVYILPNGLYYHSRADCSSLASYVKKVPLEQVAELGVCSYCGGK